MDATLLIDLSRHKRLRRSSILNRRRGLQSHDGWDTNDLGSQGFESANRVMIAEGEIEATAYFQTLILEYLAM